MNAKGKAAQEWSPSAQDALARFQRVAEDFVESLGNLAVIAAIDAGPRGRAYVAAGLADAEGSAPATPERLFQIGSQTKTVVALTMLTLEREGRIELDRPVLDYIDLPIDARITVRHLLMNTSGMGEMTFAMPPARRDPRRIFAPRDLVALAVPQGQLFEPGTRFEYCNTGWVIAAMLIEAVTGQSYAEAVRQRTLQPLQLEDTVVGGGWPKDRMLRGYIETEATGRPVDAADALSWAFGAGDGVSSLDDMLDLFVALNAQTSPLGLTLADLSHTPAKPAPSPYFPLSLGAEYGLGVERRTWAGSEVWGHPGSTNCYMTGTWLDPARGVCVSTCVTRSVKLPLTPEAELRYPRAQLFAMALNAAYVMVS